MKHRVVEVNIIRGNVILIFESGEAAIYPADLLHELLPQLERVSAADGPDIPEDVVGPVAD